MFTRSHRLAIWTTAVLVWAALVASAATAAPKLYHSPGDTGIAPADTPSLPLGGTPVLYLYLDPGSVPTSNGGTPCNGGIGGMGGNGDETCGVNFEVRVSGDLSIMNFNPDSIGMEEFTLTGDTLKVAIVTTNPHLSAVPTRVGTMQIDTSGPQGGTGNLVMLQTVDADLELKTGAPDELFTVPEPGFLSLLLPGAGLLAFLARARIRREAA